jgi:hypothetical protein
MGNMEYIGNGSVEKRKHSTFSIVVSILFSMIMIQISVTIYSATALAAPRANCLNPAPSDSDSSASQAPATPGIVLINEVLTSPHLQWTCTLFNNSISNQEDAWIEIYNPQSQPLNLYAAHTSIDQGPGTQPSIVPFGSIIEAHGFLALFPLTNTTPISQVRLTISQVVIDQISVPSLADDTSYARIPDGSNNWQVTTAPTLASSNILSTVTSTKTATKTAKTPKATSTPKHTTTRQSTNTYGAATSNDGAGIDTSNTGEQPTWSALRLPSSHANTLQTDNTSQNNPATPSPSSNSPADFTALISKIVLTLLMVVFVFALLWGWQRYKKRKSTGP